MPINRTRRLLVLAVPAALLAQAAPGAQETREVRVVARRFVFEPSTIDAVLGVPLLLRFTSPEVTMGFSLPDFKTRADLIAGRETVVRVTPDKAGSFTFVCDIFCGNGHEDMQGILNVKG
jgi:cytochrome c oxidase subunit II